MLGAGGDRPDEVLAGACLGADVTGGQEFAVVPAAADAGAGVELVIGVER
jgi:hypothetical protein